VVSSIVGGRVIFERERGRERFENVMKTDIKKAKAAVAREGEKRDERKRSKKQNVQEPMKTVILSFLV